MTLTRARTIQYVGILLALAIIAVGYWYWQASAGVKRNTSVAQPQGTGRLDAGLAAYWRLDETTGSSAADSSVNGNTGTLTNMENGDWVTGQIGNGLDFDGSNEYVSLGDVVEPGVITISAWINPDAVNTDKRIVSKWGGAGSRQYLLSTDDSTNSAITFAVDAAGGFEICDTPANAYAAGSWTHVVGVYSSGTCRIYINGADTNATISDGSANGNIVNTATSLNIGRESDGTKYFDGRIDEVRIYDRGLSADEVAQLYRLTTPTSVDTSLRGYWSFNATDISGTTGYDRSGAGNHGTLTNGPVPTKGVSGQALQFDGSNDEFVVPDSASLRANAGSWSISFWAKPSDTNQNSGLVSKRDSNTPFEQYGVVICGDDVCAGSGQRAVFFMREDASNLRTFTTAGDVVDGNWHHFTAVANQAANMVQIYIDGSPVAGATTSSGSWPTINNSDSLRIGSANTVAYTNAPIDEVRVYNRALGTDEIKSLYEAVNPDELNSAVSQPGGAGRLDAALSGYWRLDETTGSSAADSSVNGNNGTLNSMENGDWMTGRIGNGLTFDGAGEYVSTSATVPSRGSFGAWVNTSSALTGTAGVYTFLGSAAAGNYTLLQFNGYSSYNGWVFGMRGAYGADVEIEGPEYTDTSYQGWHHVFVTWDTSQGATVYVDGAYYSSTTSTTGAFDSMTLNINNSDSNNDWPGLVDEVRMYDRILSADEVSRLYRLTTPTAVDTSLKGYWSFDASTTVSTTAYDLSGARNNGTLTNSPTRTVGRVGQALDFDGTDDRVVVAHNTNLPGNTDATFSGWFWRDTFTTDDTLVAKRNSQSAADTGFITYIDDATDRLVFEVSNGSDEYSLTSSSTFTSTGWNFFSVVWSASGPSNSKMYINGIDDQATHNAGTWIISDPSNSLSLVMGAESDGGNPFDGKLDETRVSITMMTAAQAKSLYDASNPDKVNTSVSQSQGTGQLDSGLTGYWPLDNGSGTSATDLSTNGNTGTLTNGPTWSTGQIGGAVDFDGSNDHVVITDNAVFDMVASQQYSWSMWINPDGFAEWSNVWAQGASTTSGFYIYAHTSTDPDWHVTQGIVVGYIASSGNILTTTSYDNILTTGQWQHVMVTYDGSQSAANRFRIYVNGVNRTDPSGSTIVGTLGTITPDQIWMGRNPDYLAEIYDGDIDEVRLYNRLLSPDEITNLYRLGTPTGTDTSLKGYWSFNGQDMNGTTALDRSGAGNNGTLTNGPTRTIGKLGQALNFDGSNDYVNAGSGGSLDDLSAVTLSFWVKPTGASLPIILKGHAGNFGSTTFYEGWGLGSRYDGVDFPTFAVARASEWMYKSVSDDFLTPNEWQYVTVTWDGTLSASGIRFYRNGVETPSYAVNNGSGARVGDSTRDLWLATDSYNGLYFNGSLDEVRVYNRVLSVEEVRSLYAQGR